MGRPLSAAFFGSEEGKIAIQFHDGSSVVTGYIVRQMGSTRYEVTQDGDTMFVVELAQTTAEAEDLVEGMATITATTADDEAVFVKNLQNFTALTTEGLIINWNNANSDDVATLGTITTAEPEVLVFSIDEIAEQVAGNPFSVTGVITSGSFTTMEYRVSGGSWAAAPSPQFIEGTFSFQITVAAPATGVTVEIRNQGDTSSEVSNSFDVVAS